MARVEVSQNIGPHVVKSIKNALEDTEGEVFHTSTYTVHSYQVITDSIKAATDIVFQIWATNDDGGAEGKSVATATNWIKIAEFDIEGTGVGPTNADGLMYSDIWNFKYARCKLNGTWDGSESFDVLEKHNA